MKVRSAGDGVGWDEMVPVAVFKGERMALEVYFGIWQLCPQKWSPEKNHLIWLFSVNSYFHQQE